MQYGMLAALRSQCINTLYYIVAHNLKKICYTEFRGLHQCLRCLYF